MNLPDFVQLVGQFGVAGVLVIYLVWDGQQKAKWLQKHRDERLQADKDETASREKLASALTALTMVIEGRNRRVR
jgi:hypothetical protein